MPAALAPFRPAPRGRVFMTADAVGGIFSYALELARGLEPYGIETTLALLGPAASPAQWGRAAAVPGLRMIETGLPLDWLAPDERAHAAAARELAALASECRPDIVHLNAPALADADYPCPVVAVLHSCLASWWQAVRSGPMPEDFRWRTELAARGLSRADRVVCPSAAFAAEASRLYGCQVEVVQNGLAAPRGDAPPGEPVACVLTSGRLWDEGKNFETLVRAKSAIAAPVMAAGPLEGPDGSRIEAGGVEALGTLDAPALRAHLAERPVFVSTALYEPFGLGVLEAAQAGCALVLSDIPTFRELWDGAALFVPPRNAEAVAAAVNGLLRRPVAGDRLGTAARARAARYAIEATARSMLAIYARLGAGPMGAAA